MEDLSIRKLQKPKGFKPHPFEYHDIIEIKIETLTNRGLGLGRFNGWVVMVKFALPGEHIKARIFKNHSNYSEADLLEVVTPSPERTLPLCPLFKKCGGCQYQHLDYPGQLVWKQKQTQEILERIGTSICKVEPTWPSPKPYYYRSKLTPHFPRPNPKEISFPIGFLEDGSRHAIIDVPSCPLATEAINNALKDARPKLKGRLPTLKRGGTLLFRECKEGVVEDPKAIVTQVINEIHYQVTAGEFFQNNPSILPDFVSYILAEAAQENCDYLIDAYCGVGLFALAGARTFKQVLGIEVNTKAVELARKNTELNGLVNVSFVLGEAQTIFAHVNFPSKQTAIILDPPRKGCDLSFLEQLISFGPQRIVYVACDVATQARDTAILLSNGYQVTKAQPFDLFPQTKHIENILSLTKVFV